MLLRDREVTRQSIIEAMNRLITESRPGDLAFISFAGHGAQLPERIAGSNPNGLDEVFVLSAFEARGPGTAERILDKEINTWLKRLEQRGVATLFVADTCHGGGLSRAVDARAEEISYRLASISRVDLDELKPISTPADAMLDQSEMQQLTFLAAVDKNTKAPEVRIPGADTLRGALSYAVARVIEGGTPKLLEDGLVTRKRLFEYARQIVSQYSESRQVITVEPVRSTALLDTAVFRFSNPPTPATEQARPWKDTPVSLRVIGGAAASLASMEPVGTPFKVVGANDSAELVWDAASGDVVTAGGSIIYTGASDRDLPGIVDRTRALTALAKLSETRPQTIVLKPNNGIHRNGARVAFEAENVRAQAVVVLNIAGNGTVQMLYPRPSDDTVFRGGTWRLPLVVSEPFGNDTVVAVVSDQPRPELVERLRRVDGKKAATLVTQILEQELQKTPSAKLGMVGLFTAR
jgi:hypothetical protein